MPLEEFIIWIYCFVEDEVMAFLNSQGGPIRKRGFAPKLTDAEVITMEVIGEFLGKDNDKAIWSYFRNHWLEWFPNLGSRANFAKQASNLWALKQFIHKRLISNLGANDETVHIVDGFPVELCHFKRAKRCQRLKEFADYGYCASKEEAFYGLKGHALITYDGIIVDLVMTSASGSEREACFDMTESFTGLLLGDKGYIGTHFKDELKAEGIELSTPVKKNMHDPLSKCLRDTANKARRLVETVIGQLTGRFSLTKVWARDAWHLTNRIIRKGLAHTLGVYANQQHNRKKLELDAVISS